MQSGPSAFLGQVSEEILGVGGIWSDITPDLHISSDFLQYAFSAQWGHACMHFYMGHVRICSYVVLT